MFNAFIKSSTNILSNAIQVGSPIIAYGYLYQLLVYLEYQIKINSNNNKQIFFCIVQKKTKIKMYLRNN
jgi:hypothetical protein